MNASTARNACAGWRTPSVTVNNQFGGIDTHGAITGIRATAAQFVSHSQTYHTVTVRVAALHDMLMNTLAGNACSYGLAAAANAAATI
jgi:PE family protein